LPEDSRRREIPAVWITKLVQQPQKVVRQRIEVRNAVIVGNINLAYVEFQDEIHFLACRFKGVVDLSFSHFSRAFVLNECKFEQAVKLNGVRADADVEWTKAEFDDVLECQDGTITRNLSSQGALFQECNFEGATIGGQAIFKDDESPAAHFRGEATFDLIKIGGGLHLDGAVFDLEARFTGAVIQGYAIFSGAMFRGRAQFDGIVIEGDADFENAKFWPTPTVDIGKASIRFPGARIDGQADFEHVLFGDYVRFDLVRFGAEAFFEFAEFLGQVSFDSASFKGPARFNCTIFSTPDPMARISFRGATSTNDIEYKGAQFKGGIVSFQDVNFKVVYFCDSLEARLPKDKPGPCPKAEGGELGRDSLEPRVPKDEPRQFPKAGSGELDLRGFCYERIFIDWREALSVLKPYDIQPYRQMERAFRTMGKDRDADGVYLQQRRRALAPETFWDWPKSIAGYLYWGVARFGVRPWRLGVFSITLILISMFVYHQPGSVTAIKDSGCVAHALNRREALGVSLNYFLPIPVPVASCWAASGKTAFSPFGQPVSFMLWGTLLKLLGWIFVPLGVAALSGVLRRDPLK
jgi:hypothetical protein